MEWRRVGYIIILIKKKVQKQVLKHLALKEKVEILKRVKNY